MTVYYECNAHGKMKNPTIDYGKRRCPICGRILRRKETGVQKKLFE